MILLEKFNLKTHFVTTLIGNHSKFRIKTNQKKLQSIMRSWHLANFVGFLILLKCDYKQQLDEVFVISRLIKVEVGVISRSRRLRLITLTETLIILDITKTVESNFLLLLHTERKKWKSCFLLLH